MGAPDSFYFIVNDGVGSIDVEGGAEHTLGDFLASQKSVHGAVGTRIPAGR